MYICTYMYTYNTSHSVRPCASNYLVITTLRSIAVETKEQHLCNATTHCNTLQHTVTHCNKIQYTATHLCVMLQHTAAQYNTPQHTAIHCNTA